jgi:hypothetical protein
MMVVVFLIGRIADKVLPTSSHMIIKVEGWKVGRACMLGVSQWHIGPLQNMEISRLPHRSASIMIAEVR